jgi:DNA modification methylase
MGARRRATATSSFGVSRRESHDASAFYDRFTPPEVSTDEEVSPRKQIDKIILGDARRMEEIDDRSVALVVTSPPYFAGKDYEADLGEGYVPATYANFLSMLEEVFAECLRKLEPGGRIAVNVANLGRKPYRSLAGDVNFILQDRLRMLLRGEVVWVKARGATGSCAWGSFQRPTNPVLRDLTERVVIASKGRFDRALSLKQRQKLGLPSEATITRDEFLEATTDVWEIPAESARRVGHPAPFPVELPARLIDLYTYRGDLVLDPFIGSGTTAIAAVRSGRHYAGYETDPAYADSARARVARELRTDPEPVPGALGSGGIAKALADGLSARDVAEIALGEAGFVNLVSAERVGPGIEVTLGADGAGMHWHFELVGGFTSTRPGLRGSDALSRAIAKAALHKAVSPETPFVVLTTELPESSAGGRAALDLVVGEGQPITDVIVLGSPKHHERLRRLAAGSDRQARR